MRTFVFKDATSDKFWNIELQGQLFTVTYGRAGTKGQSQTKAFADAATAKKEHDKLVAQKLKKGYIETTASGANVPAPPVSTERAALETALVAHPDEVAAHSAYADLLTEEGDPRGELIQAQLALEDEARPKKERDALRKRESALLKAHTKEWMGDVGRFLIGSWSGEDKPYCYRFARGWLDTVRTLPFPEALVKVIAQSPETRLLRRLEIVYDMSYHPNDFHKVMEGPNDALPEDERMDEDELFMDDCALSLSPLVKSPSLTNLRVLKYGFSDDHENGPSHSTMVRPFDPNVRDLLDLLSNCPRLEELYLNADLEAVEDLFASKRLSNLRVFQYYYGTRRYDGPNPYPLSALAKNKALTNLHTLHFHPGRDATIAIAELDALLKSKNLPALAELQVHMTTFGDDGAERIVASGILKRLKTLDVGYGNMTDVGARSLAACADLKNLEVLNVSHNALTKAGIAALKKVAPTVIATDQHGTGEDDNDYLYSVDWE